MAFYIRISLISLTRCLRSYHSFCCNWWNDWYRLLLIQFEPCHSQFYVTYLPVTHTIHVWCIHPHLVDFMVSLGKYVYIYIIHGSYGYLHAPGEKILNCKWYIKANLFMKQCQQQKIHLPPKVASSQGNCSLFLWIASGYNLYMYLFMYNYIYIYRYDIILNHSCTSGQSNMVMFKSLNLFTHFCVCGLIVVRQGFQSIAHPSNWPETIQFRGAFMGVTSGVFLFEAPPKKWYLCSRNHGSVKYGCISNRIATL